MLVMPSIRSTIRLALALVAASFVVWSTADRAGSEQFSPPAGPLPQTNALDWPEEDLSGRMMDGAHRFVERQIADSQARSGRFWNYDTSSNTAWNRSVENNRDRLREIIGVVDARRPPGLERFGDDESPALVAETSRYRVYQVRWPVLDGLSAEGLLVQPTGTPTAHIVAVPDAGQTPEQILGLSPGLTREQQFARRLAESNCELVIPVLVRRELIQTADEQLQRSQQTWREWLYRQAFHMGRHIIGYEVQKVLAAVDGFRARRGDLSAGARSAKVAAAKVGVVGYAYQQLTADSGQPAILGDFKSRVFGIGPQLGYVFPAADSVQGFLGLKGYYEFGAENRPEGWNAWVTLAFSPAEKPKAPSRPMITK
jgi:hypothetical protein